ncbi:MAG: DUF4203 domain-containing protein [Desulfobacterales bacterium]|nr:MAG: DUF4203 domain-containing protein [Desulfobacterales bacterium]
MIVASGYSGTVVNILIGILVLTFGRKLFWLFVGCLGFAVGFHYAPYVWQVQSNLFLLILATITGIVGAVLALFFQKIAIALAGFAGGGYIALNLLNLLGLRLEQIIWLPFLIGGIIGALLLFFIFDWALIFVSSLTGATMIIQAAKLSPVVELIVYFALVIAGVVIQTALYQKTSTVQRETKD